MCFCLFVLAPAAFAWVVCESVCLDVCVVPVALGDV